jgi:hypothetical protein
VTPQEEIDRILKDKDLPLTQDILVINRKMRAETAVKRNELRELYEEFQADMNALLENRQAIRERVLRIWKAHFDGEVTLDLPAAMISRRNKPELKVRDITALLNALDAADRLDLVSYVFSDREIISLFRKGELKGLPEKAIAVVDNYDLQVRPKEKKIGKKRKHK